VGKACPGHKARVTRSDHCNPHLMFSLSMASEPPSMAAGRLPALTAVATAARSRDRAG
jgi:hypothetical protein